MRNVCGFLCFSVLIRFLRYDTKSNTRAAHFSFDVCFALGQAGNMLLLSMPCVVQVTETPLHCAGRVAKLCLRAYLCSRNRAVKAGSYFGHV